MQSTAPLDECFCIHKDEEETHSFSFSELPRFAPWAPAPKERNMNINWITNRIWIQSYACDYKYTYEYSPGVPPPVSGRCQFIACSIWRQSTHYFGCGPKQLSWPLSATSHRKGRLSAAISVCVCVTELLLLVAAAFSPGPSLSWPLGERWSKGLPLFWGSCRLIRNGPFAYTSPIHQQVMFSGTDVQCVFMRSIGHAQRKGPFKVRRYGKRLQGGSKDLRWLWKGW